MNIEQGTPYKCKISVKTENITKVACEERGIKQMALVKIAIGRICRRRNLNTVLRIRILMFLGLLDSDPDPVVGTRPGFGSGSFYNQAK
jgi:hypothetical protein